MPWFVFVWWVPLGLVRGGIKSALRTGCKRACARRCRRARTKVPGRGRVRIEVANDEPRSVHASSILRELAIVRAHLR